MGETPVAGGMEVFCKFATILMSPVHDLPQLLCNGSPVASCSREELRYERSLGLRVTGWGEF